MKTTRDTFSHSHGEESVKFAEWAAFLAGKSADWENEALFWLSRGESLKLRLNGIKPTVSVIIDGGCVSQVLSDCPFIRVKIVDYDNKRAGGQSSREIDGEYGGILKKTPFELT